MSKSESKTITLDKPVTVTVGDTEETVVSLTLRPPKAKDLRIRDRGKGDVDATIRLIAALSGQSVAVIDELSAEDFAAAGEIVADFM